MKQLKIGFVIDDSLDKPDGVQQYVLALGEWLRSAGHDVHYLASTTHRQDLKHLHSLSRNVGVRFNGNRLSIPLPANRAAIRALLNAEKFDVLHVQMPHSPLLAGRIISSAPASTVVVGTFHILPLGIMARCGNHLLARVLRKSLRRFDAIASVSTAAQSFAKTVYKIDSTVVPNVIDYQRFTPSINRSEQSRSSASVRIAFLGRLVPRKGCLTLLEAISILRSEHPDIPFEVVIGGRGPLEAALRQYVAKNELDSCVQFVGFIDEADKPPFLQSADIAVFPSRGGESFGIVLVEAMAAGAAVLAGNNPGYASVLVDRPEQLFEATNAEVLSQKVQKLMVDQSYRRAIQGWGKTYAREFDTSAVGERWLHIYTQALRKRRP